MSWLTGGDVGYDIDVIQDSGKKVSGENAGRTEIVNTKRGKRGEQTPCDAAVCFDGKAPRLFQEKKYMEAKMRFQHEKVSTASKYGVVIRGAIVLIAIAPLLGCCCKQVKSNEGWVPVPVQSERIVFSLPAADTEKVAAAVSCLIRTGSADKAACNPNMPICDLRRDDEVRAEYRPVLSSLNRFDFSSPFAFNNAIRSLFGGEAMGTLRVADARRTATCREWEVEGCCGAFRYKELWFLLKCGKAVHGPAQEVEVFLAGQPCRGEVTHADAR